MTKISKIIIFIVCTVGILGTYLVWNNNQPQISNITPFSASQTDSQPVGTNHAALGKDRLYTREEGKYSNLNEAEKKLLRELLAIPECENNPYKIYCFDEETVNNISLVSFRNNTLLLNIPTGKGSSYYVAYDLNQKKITETTTAYSSDQIRNDEVVIFINNNSDKTQELSYYRPGMLKFAPIPSSKIPSTESYWYYGGMGTQIPEILFRDGTLLVTVFSELKGEIGMVTPRKIREATFDLNTLQ